MLFYSLIKLYPCNDLSREYGLYKASDLLPGDHVCEKSDGVNCSLSMTIINLIMSC